MCSGSAEAGANQFSLAHPGWLDGRSWLSAPLCEAEKGIQAQGADELG